MGVRLAECSRCYIGQLDFDEWVAKWKSTTVSHICQRTMDGTRVQSDYILSDVRACVESVWHDQLIPFGLGHRCVHCVLLWGGVKPHLWDRRLNLKNWTPILDIDGTASLFQNCLTEMLQRTSLLSCEVLEHCPIESGKQYGISGGGTVAFNPSLALKDLRNNRRQTVDTVRRKEMKKERKCSRSESSIDKNFASGDLQNFRHTCAILHGGKCCGSCFGRLAMKLQINLMLMILQQCWRACSMVTMRLP